MFHSRNYNAFKSKTNFVENDLFQPSSVIQKTLRWKLAFTARTKFGSSCFPQTCVPGVMAPIGVELAKRNCKADVLTSQAYPYIATAKLLLKFKIS